MTTQFISAEVEVLPGVKLFVDGNSKVTAGNGTFDCPAPNAFSLPHISSCPGSTPTCRAACYVNGLRDNVPELYAKYALNSAALHRILMSSPSTKASARVFGNWIAENCRGGFRWHVSGDVLSLRHADWIAMVCRVAEPTRFWIYTRTLEAVPALAFQRNLTLNISVDQDNYRPDMIAFAREHEARLCYMSVDGSFPKDLPKGSVIFSDYSLRGRALAVPTDAPWWQTLSHDEKKMVCPADFFGQSETHRCGPCNKCLIKPEAV